MAIPKVMGIETEYGIITRGVEDHNPILASSVLINSFGSPRLRKVRWDYEEESPLRDARGFERPSLEPLEDEGGLVSVILDNGAPIGDTLLSLEGSQEKTGPFSTLGGALVMNMLRCEVAQRLLDRGIEPVFLPSHQFVGSRSVEEQLEYFYAQYARRIAPLYARQG